MTRAILFSLGSKIAEECSEVNQVVREGEYSQVGNEDVSVS